LHREDLHWVSPNLGMKMEFLWFGNWGRPVVIFPTSAARFYEAEDFGLIRALEGKIEAGQIQVCCPDTVNLESWYNRRIHPGHRVRLHDRYDRYLADELVPFVRHRAQRDDIAFYGASFGAYHAMNFACRHPELAKSVIAFSGVFDIHSYLDGYWDDLCYFHCPTAYLPNLDDGWLHRLSRLQLVVATGEHDHLADTNREFIDLLQRRGIPVHGEIWRGQFGHDWPFWCQHIQRFLP
jgi:esterase/lipase superfamily enzyme